MSFRRPALLILFMGFALVGSAVGCKDDLAVGANTNSADSLLAGCTDAGNDCGLGDATLHLDTLASDSDYPVNRDSCGKRLGIHPLPFAPVALGRDGQGVCLVGAVSLSPQGGQLAPPLGAKVPALTRYTLRHGKLAQIAKLSMPDELWGPKSTGISGYYAPGYCDSKRTLVQVGDWQSGDRFLVAWTKDATVAEVEPVENGAKVAIAGTTTNGAQLVKIVTPVSKVTSHAAVLGTFDSSGVSWATTTVPLPGLAYVKSGETWNSGIVDSEPIVDHSQDDGTVIASLGPGKVYLSMISNDGKYFSSSLSVKIDEQAVAVGISERNVAVVVSDGKNHRLFAVDPGGSLLWTSDGHTKWPRMMKSTGTFGWMWLIESAGGAWLVGGAAALPLEFSSILRYRKFSGAIASAPLKSYLAFDTVKSPDDGRVLLGLFALGLPSSSTTVAQLIELDAFGNSTCESSGPCWLMTPEECDDQNPCTLDRCDSSHSGCWHVALNDVQQCAPSKLCFHGVCTEG